MSPPAPIMGALATRALEGAHVALFAPRSTAAVALGLVLLGLGLGLVFRDHLTKPRKWNQLLDRGDMKTMNRWTEHKRRMSER